MTRADELLRGYEGDITITFLGPDGKDAQYPAWVLMESLESIVNKDNEYVPFRLNDQQIMIYREICDMRREHRPVRLNILKARQEGISTFIAYLFVLIGLYTPNVKIGIVADSLRHAQELFDKYQYVYDHLDDFNPWNKPDPASPSNRTYLSEHPEKSYKPKLIYNKGQRLLATKNSSIEVLAVGESSGRSMNFTYLHLSEVAFWPSMSETLLALLQTVSDRSLKSMVLFETTAKGFNEYKRRWDNDYSGLTSYKAVFLPWFANREYDDTGSYDERGWDPKRELEDWELSKMMECGLTAGQMHWFHSKYAGIDADDREMARGRVLQEYPFTQGDAFISSGSSVFSMHLLSERKDQLAKGAKEIRKGIFRASTKYSADGRLITVSCAGSGFEEIRNGPVRILEKPRPGYPYVAICDPNMGGKDDAAIQVIDNTNGHQVAVFQSSEYQPDEVALQLYMLGREYNWALASSEMNVEQSVMDFLIRMRYPKIYMSQAQAYEDLTKRVRLAYGHKTTKNNRPFMLQEMRVAFREDPMMISDYATLCEMETFQLVERTDSTGNVTSAKQQAASGQHDDLVMAYAAFYLIRGQQSAVPDESMACKAEEMTVAALEREVEKRWEKIESGEDRKGDAFGIKWD